MALIFVWFPVGLALTILHACGHDLLGMGLNRLLGGKKTQRGNADHAAVRDEIHRGTSTSQRKGVKTAAAPQKEEEAPAPTGVRRADGGAGVKTVFGWILAVLGMIVVLGSLGTVDALWTALTGLAIALGGGCLIFSAVRGRKKEAAFRQCIKISGETGIVDIPKLSRTMGWKDTDALRNLAEMIDRGYYGPDAYIDHDRGLLVIEPFAMRDVYRAEDMAEAARKEQEEKDTARAAEEAGVGQEYARILARIRQADIDIDDEVMSEKIRRMQTITAAIFREVEAHPEKKPQIRRFMDYYLPTTLKLLDNYARIEDRGVTGENMAKAKADIEGIADTLVAGYEKQLDTLYSAEAMDIAGDVSVIENMMRRDGLTGQSDFGPGQTMGGH